MTRRFKRLWPGGLQRKRTSDWGAKASLGQLIKKRRKS